MKKMNIKKILLFAFVGVFSFGLCLIPLFRTNNVSANTEDYDSYNYSIFNNSVVDFNYTVNEVGLGVYNGLEFVHDFNLNNIDNSLHIPYFYYNSLDWTNSTDSDVGGFYLEHYFFMESSNNDFTSANVRLPIVSYTNINDVNQAWLTENIYFNFINNVSLIFNDIIIPNSADFNSAVNYILNSMYINYNNVLHYSLEVDYHYLDTNDNIIKTDTYVNDYNTSYDIIDLYRFNYFDFEPENFIDYFIEYDNKQFYYIPRLKISFDSFVLNGVYNGNFGLTYRNYRNTLFTNQTYNYLLTLKDKIVNDLFTESGYDSGYNLGYNSGYNVGYADALGDTQPFDVIIGTVESFLNLEIFPDFHVYYLFMISIGVMTVGLVMKLLLGG